MDSGSTCRANGSATDWLTPACFGFILIAFLFSTFPKVVLGLESFVYRDYGVLAFPVIHYARECFWRGELPLWNPLSNCGAPFLAQWGTMALYPFSIIYLLFPLPWSLSIFSLLHVFLGGMGMYWLAREWTRSGLAASIAGVTFVYNGVTLSALMWPNYTVALGWMPWVIWSATRAWRDGGRNIALAALAGSLQMLAGVPELAGFTWLIAIGFFAADWVAKRSGRMIGLGRLATVLVLVLGLTAAQLFPFFDLLAHSQRDRSFATSKWSLPGWGWANLMVPLFHCFQTYQGPFVQRGQAFFSSVYLGVGLLALAFLGVWRVRQSRVWLLFGFSLFGLIMALGEDGYVYPLLKRVLPFLGVSRYPVKFILLAAFSFPLLAAFGIRWWQDQSLSGSQRGVRNFLGVGLLLAGGISFLLWFVLRYPFPLDQWDPTWRNALSRIFFLALILGAGAAFPRVPTGVLSKGIAVGILLLFALDIKTHLPIFNPTIAVSEFQSGLWQRFQHSPTAEPGFDRVMISPQAERLLLTSTETNLARDFLCKRLALWSNLNLLDSVPKVNGSSTLQIREQHQIESFLYANSETLPIGLLDFLGVSQTTSPANALEWVSRTNYCPLVTCGQKPVFASAPETLERITAQDFDPRSTVYLPLEAKNLLAVSNRTDCTILDTRFASHQLEIEVEAKSPSLVVIAQTFYHPWRASIDGRPLSVLKANYAFQAVEAPVGHSRILLRYEDHNFTAGAVVSGLVWPLCLVMGIRRGKRLEDAPLDAQAVVQPL